MLPLTLVTGFLGSGKTTLLRRFADRDAAPVRAGSRRLVFLVNEFAAVDIDGRLLGEGVDHVTVAGGSIFCTCKVTDFVEQLGRLADRHRTTPFAGVVVEASGIADPRVIRRMLAETGLDRRYFLSRVVAVADPVTLPKLLHTLPAIRRQLESADVVLLNKTDLASEAQVRAAEAVIAEANASAAVVRCVRCEVDLDAVVPANDRRIDGPYAACVDPTFCRFTLQVSDAPTRVELSGRLRAVADDLYRVKGWVRCAEGVSYVELSSGRLTVTADSPDTTTPTGLVVIGRGETGPRLEAALRGPSHAETGCP